MGTLVRDTDGAVRRRRRAELPSWLSFVFACGLVIVAAGFLALVIRGVVRLWNPIPFWDMWSGDIAFWYELVDGKGLIAFWEQNNEHRILLAKIFFWIDMEVFRGSGIMLIVSILLSLALIAVVLVWALRHHLVESRGTAGPLAGFLALAALIVVIQGSWMQWENLVWGYQIQFVLATLLPLVALLLGGRSQAQGVGVKRSRLLIAGALAASIASVLTMANGLIAPWLLLVLLLVLRASPRRWIVAGAVAVAMTVMYAIGYTTPATTGNPLTALSDPVGVMKYLLSYLGGPLFHATGSSWVGELAGVLAIVVVIGSTVRIVRTRGSSPVGLALVAFVWFLVGSGLLTALGRAVFGVEQGLSSRYQTPVLAMWATLLVIAAPAVMGLFERRPLSVLLGVALMVALLVPQQLAARADFTAEQAGRNLATLALALDIPDNAAVGLIHFDPPYMRGLAGRVIADRLTVLGTEPYVGAAASLGQPATPVTTANACRGAVETVKAVTASRFDRVSGWIELPDSVAAKADVDALVDVKGDIVGYVAYGSVPSGVIDPPAEAGVTVTGFVGYVSRGAIANYLVVSGQDTSCSLGG